MKLSRFIITALVYLAFFVPVYAKEVNFESSNIKILEDGNIIKSLNVVADIPEDKVQISGQNSEFNKINEVLTINKNVKYFDINQDIKIESDKIIYNIKEEIINSYGNTKIYLYGKYKIVSKDITYNKLKEEIFQVKKQQFMIIKKIYTVFKTISNLILEMKL